MQVKLDGKNLVVTIPFDSTGHESKSGKTMIHASSGGNQPTALQIDGKPIVIGLNAYTRA